MLLWLSQHSDALLVITNVGMLVIWLFYAQLLLNSVLKQRRPRVLINEGKGRDLDAEIIIANMSAEPIYIQLILAVVSDGDDFTRPITDAYIYNDDYPDQPPERSTTQGPVNSGAYLQPGSFRQVARQVSRESDEQPPWHALEIHVVFFYGSKTSPMAATRKFRFDEDDDGKRHVYPETMDTTLWHRMWHHRRIRRWLLDYR